MFRRITSCAATCAVLVVTSSVNAQSDAEAMLILNQNAGDSQLILLGGPDDSVIRSLNALEPRTVLMPPGEDDMLPASATAVISINGAGSYILGGNVIGVAGKHGIEIKNSNVTLDLNGFAVIGTPDAKHAIHVPDGVVNVTIKNGAIRGWPMRGIDGKRMTASRITGVLVGNCKWHGIYLGQGIVEDCIARANGGDGIHVVNGRSVVESCTVELNGGDGVEVAEYTTVRDVTASGSAEDGIAAGIGCSITGCTSADNGNWGIVTGMTSTITGCTAFLNKLDGIRGGGHCVVELCAARSNSRQGIMVSGSGVITGCESSFNGGRGIYAQTNSVITSCTATFNGETGIVVADASAVSSCSVVGNTGAGIQTTYGSAIRDCVVRQHGNADKCGIQASGDCSVSGNTLDNNDIGIWVTDSDNRIDGNNVTDSQTGILVSISGNMVVRNSVASTTTPYTVATGNLMSTVKTSTVGAGPWDNFAY